MMEYYQRQNRIIYEAKIRIIEVETLDASQCYVYGQCPVCNVEYGFPVGDRNMTDRVLKAVSLVAKGILCCHHIRNISEGEKK